MSQHKKYERFWSNRLWKWCRERFCRWRERVKTKKLLMAMDEYRLKDIGMTRDDVDKL